uniref:SANT and BTB domain-containing protein n=1 Tax=Biomphalaria glabrata TaxID=6526 RepID=A0A2C9LIL3_BIOGL
MEMYTTHSVEPSIGVTLDLILKTLIESPDFSSLETKNWEAISHLIPGTTPMQCARRYEELLTNGGNSMLQHVTRALDNLTLAGSVSGTSLAESESSVRSASSSRPSSSKAKGVREDKEKQSASKENIQRREIGLKGPVMVIHVCDEGKNLKKDFQCPRDLLVQEMRYFSEYLSTDAQRWEDVDISVHCDVQIFDWLMHYVKRGTKEAPQEPKLEPNNVVSILISSEFLKMDTLVEECIKYCHKNMNDILATPCNMGCINDKLLTRMAELFSHVEADELRDRKDKFKRMTIDQNGQMTYSHVVDSTFDVSDYVLELKSTLKTWRDVYWRLWGMVNYFTCVRCGEVFPLTEFGHCIYHPELARYDNEPGSVTSCVGIHPCCHQRAIRFDPTLINKNVVNNQCLNLLVKFHLKCKLLATSTESDMDLDVFGNESFVCHSEDSGIHLPSLSAMGSEEVRIETKPRLQPLTVEKEVSYYVDEFDESDDEVGDDEQQSSAGSTSTKKSSRALKKSLVTVNPQAILLDGPEFDQIKKNTWDTQKSLRYNQDTQRQEDARRMKEIRLFLSRLRLSADKVDKPKKEYAGGIFSKLENQWRTAHIQFYPSRSLQPLTLRARPKPLGQLQQKQPLI